MLFENGRKKVSRYKASQWCDFKVFKDRKERSHLIIFSKNKM